MSSAEAQVAYNKGSESARPPVEAQVQFATQYGIDENPDRAMSMYQQLMHQHTKQQFETATASLRRRSDTSDLSSPISAQPRQDSIGSAAS